MTTKSYEKIKREVKQELLEEFVFPILKEIRDPEGEYKESFIKSVFKISKKKPTHVYNSKTFLKEIS